MTDPETALTVAFWGHDTSTGARKTAAHALDALAEAGYAVVKRPLATQSNHEARAERLAAATELRHVTAMLDIEQIPFLSPLAVQQVRIAIGFLQQQAAGLMNAERSGESDPDA
jgi:membrane-bound lytic murein transglycosylase B